MPSATRRFSSVDDYLAGEPRSEIRHECIGGDVYAMAGASEEHSLISGNLYVALRQHLGTGPCKTFVADMKVRLEIARDDILLPGRLGDVRSRRHASLLQDPTLPDRRGAFARYGTL